VQCQFYDRYDNKNNEIESVNQQNRFYTIKSSLAVVANSEMIDWSNFLLRFIIKLYHKFPSTAD